MKIGTHMVKPTNAQKNFRSKKNSNNQRQQSADFAANLFNRTGPIKIPAQTQELHQAFSNEDIPRQPKPKIQQYQRPSSGKRQGKQSSSPGINAIAQPMQILGQNHVNRKGGQRKNSPANPSQFPFAQAQIYGLHSRNLTGMPG